MTKHEDYSDKFISSILREVRSIAVVGASANPARPSFFVQKYLIDKGYTVFPVNPGRAGSEILGRPVYARLQDIEVPVDMVDLFRESKAVAGMIDPILEMRPLPKVVWMQLRVRDDESAEILEARGIKVVMNRCPKIEYGRLSGEIGWSGVNSRVISSRRPVVRQGYQSLGIRQQ